MWITAHSTQMKIDLVIPALNEEQAIAKLLLELPPNMLRRVLVVDNGSTDNTAKMASQGGAEVLSELRRGYGYAVWAGIEDLMDDPPDAVAIMAGDCSDDPRELSLLTEVMEAQDVDMVVGTRVRVQAGSMPMVQRVGNLIVPFLLRKLMGVETTDLGSFRLVRWSALMNMNLHDRGMGMTVEMLIKCERLNLKVAEAPTTHRVRMGEQKISGTLRGSTRAAAKILWTIVRYRFFE